MLIECIEKNPLAFHILPFDNPKAQRTLQAANLETKQLWCLEIKRVILENFDAAIPEKAKQMVLNMADIYSRPKHSDVDPPGRSVLEETTEDAVPRRKSTSVLPGKPSCKSVGPKRFQWRSLINRVAR